MGECIFHLDSDGEFVIESNFYFDMFNAKKYYSKIGGLFLLLLQHMYVYVIFLKMFI